MNTAHFKTIRINAVQNAIGSNRSIGVYRGSHSFLAVQREFQKYDSLMSNLDLVNPMAVILQPDFVSRAQLYSNLEGSDKSLSITAPSLREQEEIRKAAVGLSKNMEQLSGSSAYVGYLKLAVLWEKLNENNAAQTTLNNALKVADSDIQEWTARSRIEFAYKSKEDDKAIESLRAFVTPQRADTFLVEYAHLSIALIYESMGKTEEAKTSSFCYPYKVQRRVRTTLESFG